MPRRIVAKAGFLHTYHQLAGAEQHQVDAALKRLQDYLDTGMAPAGLGLKRVGGRTYEIRVGLALRIIYVAEGDEVVLTLLGNHDDVRRFLRRQ